MCDKLENHGVKLKLPYYSAYRRFGSNRNVAGEIQTLIDGEMVLVMRGTMIEEI